MITKLKIIIILAVFAAAGCASIFNPYEDNFSCPDYDKGQCVPVEDAYKQSFQNKKSDYRQTPKEFEESCKKCKKQAKKKGADAREYCASCFGDEEAYSGPVRMGISVGSEGIYRKEVNRKLASMLRKPVTPVISNPSVLRGIIMPYRGDMGELYGLRHFYIMVDEPRFVIGNEIMQDE